MPERQGPCRKVIVSLKKAQHCVLLFLEQKSVLQHPGAVCEAREAVPGLIKGSDVDVGRCSPCDEACENHEQIDMKMRDTEENTHTHTKTQAAYPSRGSRPNVYPDGRNIAVCLELQKDIQPTQHFQIQLFLVRSPKPKALANFSGDKSI